MSQTAEKDKIENPPTEKKEEPHVHEAISLEEYEALKNEVGSLKRQISGYKMRESVYRKAQKTEPTPAPTETPAEEPKTEEKNPHYVGSWQQYCPDCGDKNPEFKDETICNPKKGGCGMHLGAASEVEKMKACPNCGGKHAARL